MSKQYWADCSTKNCVWLFQTKQKQYVDGCNCDIYDEDGELKEGETDKDCPCFTTHWNTEGVFLTREEVRSHGKARPYEWGDEDEGWRIYGTQAHGIMVELLGQHNKEFEKEVEYISEYSSQNKKSCGLLVAIEGSTGIKCGQIMLGKRRYCMRCQKENKGVTDGKY